MFPFWISQELMFIGQEKYMTAPPAIQKCMPGRIWTESLQFGSENGQQIRVRAFTWIFFIFRAHMLWMPRLRQETCCPWGCSFPKCSSQMWALLLPSQWETETRALVKAEATLERSAPQQSTPCRNQTFINYMKTVVSSNCWLGKPISKYVWV